MELKRYNKRLKVLLSVGDTKPEIFSNVAANLTKRKTFAQSARFYLSKFGFDGLDLDWETPLKTDKVNLDNGTAHSNKLYVFSKILFPSSEIFVRNSKIPIG